MAALPSFVERAESILRVTLVYAFVVFLFLMNLVSFDWIFDQGIRIPLFLMVIYYWSVYRPTLLPVWAVFLAGVLYDLVAGLPIGMTALVYVLVQWFVRDQRVFLMGQPYMMLWLGFAIVSVVSGIMMWLVYSILQMHFFLPLWPALGTAALGTFCFPVGSLLLQLTHKILPEYEANFGS